MFRSLETVEHRARRASFMVRLALLVVASTWGIATSQCQGRCIDPSEDWDNDQVVDFGGGDIVDFKSTIVGAADHQRLASLEFEYDVITSGDTCEDTPGWASVFDEEECKYAGNLHRCGLQVQRVSCGSGTGNPCGCFYDEGVFPNDPEWCSGKVHAHGGFNGATYTFVPSQGLQNLGTTSTGSGYQYWASSITVVGDTCQMNLYGGRDGGGWAKSFTQSRIATGNFPNDEAASVEMIGSPARTLSWAQGCGVPVEEDPFQWKKPCVHTLSVADTIGLYETPSEALTACVAESRCVGVIDYSPSSTSCGMPSKCYRTAKKLTHWSGDNCSPIYSWTGWLKQQSTCSTEKACLCRASDGSYVKVVSETCASHGYSLVESSNECQAAAGLLRLRGPDAVTDPIGRYQCDQSHMSYSGDATNNPTLFSRCNNANRASKCSLWANSATERPGYLHFREDDYTPTNQAPWTCPYDNPRSCSSKARCLCKRPKLDSPPPPPPPPVLPPGTTASPPPPRPAPLACSCSGVVLPGEPTSTCSAVGDPHYRNLYGHKFDFYSRGLCAQSMIEPSMIEPPRSRPSLLRCHVWSSPEQTSMQALPFRHAAAPSRYRFSSPS